MKSPSITRRLLPLGLCFAFCAATVSGSAAVIDDFTDGSLSIHPSGQTLYQSPLSVLGGVRKVYGSGVPTATLKIDPTAGHFAFDASSGFGYFSLGYGTTTPLGVNLRADGSDAFLLTFSDLDMPGLYRGRYYLHVNGIGYDLLPKLAALSGAGTVQIPFSAFSAGPTFIASSIELEASRVESGYRLVLDSITTIPEPSTSMLFALSLAFLTFRKMPNHALQ